MTNYVKVPLTVSLYYTPSSTVYCVVVHDLLNMTCVMIISPDWKCM